MRGSGGVEVLQAVWRVVGAVAGRGGGVLSGVRAEMAEFPPPMRKPRVVVVAVNSVDEIEACLAELTGISVQGGNA
jgi:hypothetical protein